MDERFCKELQTCSPDSRTCDEVSSTNVASHLLSDVFAKILFSSCISHSVAELATWSSEE